MSVSENIIDVTRDISMYLQFSIFIQSIIAGVICGEAFIFGLR